jgi:hypothetical protein
MLIFLAVDVYAEDTTSTLIKKYQEKVRQVLNKAGIDFSGEFRSEYFGANISGSGVNQEGRSTETNEYSSVDFDISARPNSFVSGRVIFRMHHNWENLWSGSNNPIFSRWISMDGVIAGKMPFHAGDFKALYTPLTLYMPEPEILFEPEIFENLRKDAMNEVFLGDHKRPLEGATLGFDALHASFLDEIHTNVLFARLRNVETSISNGIFVTNTAEADPNFSKLLFGSTFDARVLSDATIGGSFLAIADNNGSSHLPDSIADTMAQQTIIADVRAAFDFSRWITLRDSTLRIYGEAAFSFDDSAWYEDKGLHRTTIPGRTAFAGVSLKTVMKQAARINLDIKYMSNESNFRNEIAQSPAFIGRRIMNYESDSISGNGPLYNYYPNHYSTFDALYHTVFKFCPSKATNYWYRAPVSKNAYSSYVYTQGQLSKIIAGKLDPSLQLIMPMGPSTPNRQGMSVDCKVTSIDSAIRVCGVFSALSERSPDFFDTNTKANFMQSGMGLSLDISPWLKKLPYPLVLSSSYVRTKASAKGSDQSITSGFTNAGVHWQCLKSVAILSGLQIIDNTFKQNIENLKQKQTHWSVGLSWQITRGATISGSIGQIIVAIPKSLLETRGPQKDTHGHFKQLLSDISLRAYF